MSSHSISYQLEQTRARIHANVQAGLENARLRDLPDVLDWKDLAEQPEATFEVLQRRQAEGRVPGAVNRFPLPKPGKDELRRLAHVHPLDELRLRVFVDQLLDGITRPAHDGAYGARLVNGPPGWKIESSKNAWRSLRRQASNLIACGRYSTLVKCDVRRCYPSMSMQVIERALVWHGVDAKQSEPIVELLSELQLVGAPKGLPVGPEASAVIASLVLGVVDSTLRQAGITHLRYSDDSFIFVPNGSDARPVHETYCEALGSVGLEPNADKYEEHSVNDGSAWAAVQDPKISDLLHDHNPVGDDRRLVEGIEEELVNARPNWTAVSFCLGGLRYRNNPQALSLICEHPRIFQTLPRQTARYLIQMCEQDANRLQVDQDWVVEQATTDQGDKGLAAQLHACRVAARLKVGEPNGNCVESIIAEADRFEAQRTPLRAAAALAWGSSFAFRQHRAEEFALEVGNYDLRRALVAAVAGRVAKGRKTRAFHQKLRSADRDLEPVLMRLA